MSKMTQTPFPFQTQACLWAIGRWGEGGTLIIEDTELQAKVVLSPALFDLMAIPEWAQQRGATGIASGARNPRGGMTSGILRGRTYRPGSPRRARSLHRYPCRVV
jgi:hypothetical protein